MQMTYFYSVNLNKKIIKQIKLVQSYCHENALTINYDKTKIMVRNVKSKFSNLKIPVPTKEEI